MRVVGLTGGIATGKSTVSWELQKYGIPVIDADKVAHDSARIGTCGYRRVVAAFGPQVLLPDGQIDRVKLGEMVFCDGEKRRILNAAIQPAIAVGLIQQLAYHWTIGTKVVVLDAPLLFETRLNKFTKPNVVVACDTAIQEERLMNRNGFSMEQAKERIASQMPLELKCGQADFLITNSGSRDELSEQVQNLVVKLSKLFSWVDLFLSRDVTAIVMVACVALWVFSF